MTDLDELFRLGTAVGDRLVERRETVAVADGSSGGLITAALLARPGASAYFVGASTIYTRPAAKAFVAGLVPAPEGLRGATEDWATWLARSVRAALETTWGVGEGGATGPGGNPYGDPSGHGWVAIDGPSASARRLATGSEDRRANMISFAIAALELLGDALGDAGPDA